MSTKFYETADKLDDLKKRQNFDSAEISELIEYIKEEKYARYFFNDLNNYALVLPLHEKGGFNKVPPPREDSKSPGFFSMPVWYAGEYLKRMADKYPGIVKEVAISLETENSRAIRTMLESLIKVPAKITAEIVGEFKRWVETPFANFMMLSHELGIIMEYLAKNEQIEAALTVLEVLLEPVTTRDRLNEENLVATTRHDSYWLNEAIKLNLPVLTEIDPIGVINVAETQFFAAIELEQGPKIDAKSKKINSYWRLSISPRSDLNYENDLKNLLVNIIILALSKACEQRQEEAPKTIARYLKSEYMILRRLGIYILRTWGKQYPDLLEKAYRDYRKERIHAGEYEFERFVEIQFTNLPEFAQKEIIEERKYPDPQRVDEILKHHPERIIGSTLDEKRQTLEEEWQFRQLAPIASFLESDDKEQLDILFEKYGEPPPRTEEGVVVTSWEGPESPIELAELAKKTIPDVIQYLLGFPIPSDDFGKPSREGLARTLEIDVQARANEYSDHAELFINENLPFVYHTYLLRGLEKVIKNQEKFFFSNVISLCEFIASQVKDEFQKSEYEEGLPAAKLAIVQLFEEIFRVKDPFLEDGVLKRCEKIIIDLLHQDEPFTVDEKDTGFDPATHSLNCLHGVAMHAIVAYGLYCERKRNKEEGESGKPAMVPLLKETLTNQLDKSRYPSLAVHSIFGWYFPQFIYLDKDWAIENREKIFPVENEMVEYWQSAWNAYIRFSDVYTNVFPELIKQYQRALEELPNLDKKQGVDRSDEKIATHVLKAYLIDKIKMDSKDDLLSLYYQHSDDETRSNGNFWLSKALDAEKPSSKDRTWLKIWDLWQWRVKEITSTEDKNNYVKEMGNYCRLFKNVPLDLSEMFSIIEETIKFKINGFEVMEIIKYLEKNCDQFPSLAIALLQEIILLNKDLYLMDDVKAAVKKILEQAMDADDNSKAKAVDIINLIGERGDYSWRPLLENASS